MRRNIGGLALTLVLLTAGMAHADGWTRDDVAAALVGASPLARCIVLHEDPTLDPYAVGAQGELGPVQLHPRGLLPLFYASGRSDPYSPTEAIGFLEWALANGYARHWTPVRWGLC